MTQQAAAKQRNHFTKYAIIIIALLLAYPLSFGPACWIVTRLDSSKASRPIEVFQWIYSPLIMQLLNGPEALDEPVSWYLGLGAPSESQPILSTGTSVASGRRARFLLWNRPGYSYTAGSISID